MTQLVFSMITQYARLLAGVWLAAALLAILLLPYSDDEAAESPWREAAVTVVDVPAAPHLLRLLEGRIWLGGVGVKPEEDDADAEGEETAPDRRYTLVGTLSEGGRLYGYLIVDDSEFVSVRAGDTLPGGDRVEAISAGAIEIRSMAQGELITLRLYPDAPEE